MQGFVANDSPKSKPSGNGNGDELFTAHFRKAVKTIEQTQSKQHYVDYIKARILYEEGLHETLSTLNSYTLCELFWLYERVVIRDMIFEARERDEKVKADITSSHR